MKYCYEEVLQLTYSQMDPNMHLNLFHAAALSQDMIVKFLHLLDAENHRLAEKYQAVWVIAKSFLHFYRMPGIGETIHSESVLTGLLRGRMEMESRFLGSDGGLLFTARQLLCPISMVTRRPIGLEDIEFPADAVPVPRLSAEDYLPLKRDFTGEEPVFCRTIRSSDIDFSRHFNNVMAVKYIYDTRSVAYWDTHRVTAFEVLFLGETRENETVSIFAADREGETEFLLNNGTRDSIRAYARIEAL